MWVAARLDGELVDLARKVERDASLEAIGKDSPEAIVILRHSAAHIMAQAVKSIFPEARVAIGPAIENGLYYDFDVAQPFTQEDLEKIEERMRGIVSQKLSSLEEIFLAKRQWVSSPPWGKNTRSNCSKASKIRPFQSISREISSIFAAALTSRKPVF